MTATWLLPMLLAVAGDPVLTTTVDGKDVVVAEVVRPDADVEAARAQRLAQIHARARAGHAAEALPALDALLAEYEAQYPPGATRWYVARDTGESVAYSLLAATGRDGGGHARSQVLTGIAWADAWFARGWALVELGRLDEARAALDRALHLSPWVSEYLIERAEVSKRERNWDAALADFTAAEDFSTFSPEAQRDAVKGQAMRGQAFVFIEQGKLDAAAVILRACLALNPADQRAKDELAYIETLRKP